MAHDIFTVVQLEKRWMIRVHAKHSGPYATQKDAITAAVDAAYQAGKTNPNGAQVRAQDANNAFRTEWTYGVSPYPYGIQLKDDQCL
jgi:hypothetical protein